MIEPTLHFESELWRSGYTTIIGCDEVGRGAIAGPVSVGVSVVTESVGAFPVGLRDSKLLSAVRRQRLDPLVRDWVVAGAVGMSSAVEIDADGIMMGLGRAAARAVDALDPTLVDPSTTVIVLDGKHDWLTRALRTPYRVVTRVKADRDCASVSAASVLAKVDRDALMTRHHERFPDYCWASNKGYGSADHYSAIDRIGASPLHRTTWLHAATSSLVTTE